MKGTEKQVKWAEDIQTAVISTIDSVMAMTANDPMANTEKAMEARAKFQRARDAVAACEDAGHIIAVYQTVDPRKDMQAKWKEIGRIIGNRFHNVDAVANGNRAIMALIGE